MDKEFYDKYSKEFHCAECTFLDNCLKGNEPLYGRCCEKFLRDKISELEAQLAESEEQVWALENQKLHAHNCLNKLKQQLAEYEKFMRDNEWDSIQEMQETLNKCEKKYVDIQQQLANKEKEIDERMMAFEKRCQEYYKSKEFTIEQLEKVKELMRNMDMPNNPKLYNNDMFGNGFDSHYIGVRKIIDQIIAEIKGDEVE